MPEEQAKYTGICRHVAPKAPYSVASDVYAVGTLLCLIDVKIKGDKAHNTITTREGSCSTCEDPSFIRNTLPPNTRSARNTPKNNTPKKAARATNPTQTTPNVVGLPGTVYTSHYIKTKHKGGDKDSHNAVCGAVSMCMVAYKFTNVRQLGDGERILRLMKYMLLYLKSAGKVKYTYQVLRQLA